MKKSLLILLVFVLLISGCIGGIGEGPIATNGIIIKDFSFDYSPIYAKEQVGLTIELQNVGEERGELKKVTVYGVDYKGGSSSELSWGLPGETFTMDASHSDFPENPLFPPDPTTGFEGDIWYYSWLPQAPTRIRTLTDYTFDVRVQYSYSTTYTGTIRIINDNYLRTLSNDEREKLVKQGGVVESSITGGPLSISGTSGRHFIVRSSSSDKRDMKFKVINVGSGFPYDDVNSNDIIDTSELHVVRVGSPIPNDFITCTKSKIKLSRGKDGILPCTIIVPGTGDVINKMDKKFSITLFYEYYVDGKTSITVNPTYDEGTLTPTTSPVPETTTPTTPGTECTTDRSCCQSFGGPCDTSASCVSGFCSCGTGSPCPL